MESTDLTCTKCAATWKLIKAGSDRVVCPYCKAPVGDAPSETVAAPKQTQSPPVAPPSPSPPAVAAATTPIIPPTSVEAIAPTPAPALEEPSIPATVRTIDIPDTDDPGLIDDYDDQVDPRRRRRGMNPVARTIMILVIMIFLLPIALFIVLLAVCGILIMAR